MANYTIVITEKGGKPLSKDFDRGELTIGRVQDNDIVLPKGNISKRHSRIVLRDDKFIIVDLKSTNGTFVNGKKISAPQVLKDSDKIYIGDFTLQLEMPLPDDAVAPNEDPILFPEHPRDPPIGGGGPVIVDGENGMIPAFPTARTPAPLPVPALGKKPADERESSDDDIQVATPVSVAVKEPWRQSQARTPVALQVDLPPLAALQARAAAFLLVSKPMASDGSVPPDDDATLEAVRNAAEKILAAQQKKLQGVDASDWASQIAHEVCGLGALTRLLEDSAVVEIFINGPQQILVRRAPDSSSIGIPLTPVAALLSSDEALALVVRRIMYAAGIKFDAEHPVAEARMADGTRVNAVHHAAAVLGPLVTLSRSSTRNASLQELVAEDVLSQNMATFLELCVHSRRNLVVCGGPGAGTGTVLSALAGCIPSDERIVVVEQVARLKLPQPHVVTLEPRPLGGGPSATNMRELVCNALRMRPNRVVVHEVNGAEALELSMAMAGRQDGTLFTASSGSARDCLDRLETMIRMAGLDVQDKVVREQLASSVDVIVSITRFADGSARITQIAEVTGVEVDLVTTQDIFVFKRERFDENGAVVGRFQATGMQPRFYEELNRRGDKLDPSIFRE